MNCCKKNLNNNAKKRAQVILTGAGVSEQELLEHNNYVSLYNVNMKSKEFVDGY